MLFFPQKRHGVLCRLYRKDSLSLEKNKTKQNNSLAKKKAETPLPQPFQTFYLPPTQNQSKKNKPDVLFLIHNHAHLSTVSQKMSVLCGGKAQD